MSDRHFRGGGFTELDCGSVHDAQLLDHVQLSCNCMDCSLPGYSVHGILQARILERVAISSSRGPSQPRGWNLHLLHW